MLAIHPTLQGTHAVRLLLARRAASARGRASKRQHVDTRLGGQRESGESASRGWCACRCTCKLRRASQCRLARQREGEGARAGWAPQSTRQREHSLASQALGGGLDEIKSARAGGLRALPVAGALSKGTPPAVAHSEHGGASSHTTTARTSGRGEVAP